MMAACNYPGGGLSKSYIYKMQKERFKFFKLQDVEKGHFDVMFEVEGKNLFAHKFIITPISEPLNAMMSDRWSKKDEPVKVESYSHDDFYQFLHFLYTGSCNLTLENACQLVDMSEFYGVPFLKEACDLFLSKRKKFTVENYEELFEFMQKYSLVKMEDSLKDFILFTFNDVINVEKFLSCKKPFVDLLSSITCSSMNEKIFEAVYKWTEHQIIQRRVDDDGDFNLLQAVRDDLRIMFPHTYAINKIDMDSDFLTNFVVGRGFFISPHEFVALYKLYSQESGGFYLNGTTWIKIDEDYCFKRVYDLAEKQAAQKQIMDSNGESFSVVDSIKADLAYVILIAEFRNMANTFLMDFVAEKGFLLSPTVFYKIWLRHRCYFEDEEGLFEFIYNLAEKQSLKKREMSSDAESFNLVDSIKTDLAEVISHVQFYTLKTCFLMDFVVAKGIITEEQANHVGDIRVTVENNGKIVYGVFKDDLELRLAYERRESYFRINRRSTTKLRFTHAKFAVPSTPSTVAKMVGVDWYLCLDKDGVLAFKHYGAVERSDYLIAELKSRNEFYLTAGETTTVTVCFNNIIPL